MQQDQDLLTAAELSPEMIERSVRRARALRSRFIGDLLAELRRRVVKLALRALRRRQAPQESDVAIRSTRNAVGEIA